MNIFYKFILLLQSEMTEPVAYGWFHLMFIFLSFLLIFILFKLRNNHSEKQLKIVLAIYGIIAFMLEALKQLSWSFNYDSVTNIISWDYQWYSFPFQLCTTPIFVCLICLFLKKNKLRDSLLSYMAFVTILGSVMTMIIPDSCFVSDILVNIHTMWLHCGSFVVSIYLLLSKEVKINKDDLIRSIIVFLIFIIIAQTLNLTIYNSNILNGETFNMFFISPYFISTLPVFSVIQESVPYVIFLLSYILILIAGVVIVYSITYSVSKLCKKYCKKKYS